MNRPETLGRQASLPAGGGGHGGPPYKILQQIQTHASSSPGEVCGFVYGDRYIPLPNVELRNNRFFADPRSLAQALARFGEPEIIFHTHPDGNLELSAEDRRLWYYTNSTMMIGCMLKGRLRWKLYVKRGD